MLVLFINRLVPPSRITRSLYYLCQLKVFIIIAIIFCIYSCTIYYFHSNTDINAYRVDNSKCTCHGLHTAKKKTFAH